MFKNKTFFYYKLGRTTNTPIIAKLSIFIFEGKKLDVKNLNDRIGPPPDPDFAKGIHRLKLKIVYLNC